MEQNTERQSAMITDHGGNGPFSWPPMIWFGMLACLIATLVAWYKWSHHSEEHYRDIARAAIWTTYAVGNPHTYELANVRPSLQDPEAICGRINYEKINNGGWQGFSDFYIQHGVLYVALLGGRYEKQFSYLCLTAGGSMVDQPESVPTSNGMAGQEKTP